MITQEEINERKLKSIPSFKETIKIDMKDLGIDENTLIALPSCRITVDEEKFTDAWVYVGRDEVIKILGEMVFDTLRKIGKE